MLSQSTTATLLWLARKYLYRGWIRRFFQKIGIADRFSDLYGTLVCQLSHERQTHTINGQVIKFRTETYSEFMRFRELAGEGLVIEDLLESIKPDDIFFDVGANVGTYSCFAASKLGSKQTIAFEPEPRNASRLQENLQLNGLEGEIREVALSDSNGTVKFALGGEETGEGEHAIATHDDMKTIEVETARGDSIIQEHELPAPTVIKIDVEGAEFSVLRGLRDTLIDTCRLVYVEVHPEKIGAFGGSVSEVHGLLEDAGFEVVEMDHRGDEFFLRGSK